MIRNFALTLAALTLAAPALAQDARESIDNPGPDNPSLSSRGAPETEKGFRDRSMEQTAEAAEDMGEQKHPGALRGFHSSQTSAPKVQFDVDREEEMARREKQAR